MKQPRVFNRHCQPAGQQRQNILLVARKVIEVPTLDIQHPDALSLQHQRHRQLGAHAVDGINVPRVLGSIAHSHGVAGGSRGSGNSLPQRNPQIVRQLARIPDGESVPEITSIPFDHQHAKDFIIDVSLDQSRRSGQNLVQVQRGVHFLADFRECRQDLGGDLRSAVQCDCCRMFICWIHEVFIIAGGQS